MVIFRSLHYGEKQFQRGGGHELSVATPRTPRLCLGNARLFSGCANAMEVAGEQQAAEC